METYGIDEVMVLYPGESAESDILCQFPEDSRDRGRRTLPNRPLPLLPGNPDRRTALKWPSYQIEGLTINLPSHKDRHVLPPRPRPGSGLSYFVIRGSEPGMICENQIAPLSLGNRCEVSIPVPHSISYPPEKASEIPHHSSGKIKDVPSW